MKIGIIIPVILGVLASWFILTYNNFIALRTRVKEGFSTIDVFLKKRYDLIPNLVETVKGYAKHEKDTLDKVISARGKALGSLPEDKGKNEGELSSAISRLLAIAESYPDLKADSQFLNLQEQLRIIESEIEKSRRYYNGVVRELNIAVQKIPGCIVASICNFKEEPFFEIENQGEKENIQVKF